ncbi:MAG: hypothetical protein FJ294_02575 [Planctomycetes bacterium]|nr:hypothetical protein [Planctomycetota bacterium]
MIALLLCAALATDLKLPESPAARAYAALEPATVPSVLPPEVLAAAYPKHWDAEQGWQAWSARLADLRGQREPTADQRAELALSALSQGRGEDAWQHLGALAAHPGHTAALLPYLLVGGPALDLADGALFAPALPPLAGDPAKRTLGLGVLERREWWLRGIEIGAARVDVRFAVDSSGLQLEFHHQSGGDARLRVVLPEPLDMEISSVYVDWEREPAPGGEHEVLLSPEVPVMEVHGSVRPVQRRWPNVAPLVLDARAHTLGFDVIVAESDVRKPRATGLALAIASATGLDARVRSANAPPAPGEPCGIALEFAAGPERARKLRQLLSTLEHYAAAR